MTQPADNADRLRILATRLLTNGASLMEVQLLPGALPHDVAAILPLPDGVAVIGSYDRSFETGNALVRQVSMIVDMRLPFSHAIAFWQKELPSYGWVHDEQLPPYQSHGFVERARPLPQLRFTHPALGTIMASSMWVHDDITAVRINCDSSHTRSRHEFERHERLMRMLPILTSPPDSTLVEQQSGGGLTHVYSTATLVGELDLATVAAHYWAQLTAIGWQIAEQGVDSRVSWSTWTFDDSEQHSWTGSLLIFYEVVQRSQYSLVLRASCNDVGGALGSRTGAMQIVAGDIITSSSMRIIEPS